MGIAVLSGCLQTLLRSSRGIPYHRGRLPYSTFLNPAVLSAPEALLQIPTPLRTPLARSGFYFSTYPSKVLRSQWRRGDMLNVPDPVRTNDFADRVSSQPIC